MQGERSMNPTLGSLWVELDDRVADERVDLSARDGRQRIRRE